MQTLKSLSWMAVLGAAAVGCSGDGAPAEADVSGAGQTASEGPAAVSTGSTASGNPAAAAPVGTGTDAPSAGAAASTPPEPPQGTAGSKGAAGTAAPATGTATSPATCDEAMRLAPPDPVEVENTGMPATGPLQVSVEADKTLGPYTIYRPTPGERKLPIIAWGNGGCIKNGVIFAEFLMELASHGYLIIADGAPDGGLEMDDTGSGDALLHAIDWAIQENERPCSGLYQKLNTEKVAVMGQSCGGLMSMNASSDPRLSTVVLWNSGLFERDPKIYDALHAPMAIVDGGEDDVAYANGAADFEMINNVPILFANQDVGHLATYFDDNGGSYAKLGVAWLGWHLYDDLGATGKGMFVGPSCGLCADKSWTLESKMLDK